MNAPFGPGEPEQPTYSQQPRYGQGWPGGDGPPSAWGPTPSQTEPREVTLSFWLWIASVAVGVVGAVLAFVQVGAITRQVATAAAAGAGRGVDPGTFSTILTATVVVGAVFGLVFVAVEVLFAIFMRRGRNWARIVLAVFGTIGVLSALAGLFTSSTTTVAGQEIVTRSGPTTVLSLVQAVIVVGAMVLFFRPAANAWFSARR